MQMNHWLLPILFVLCLPVARAIARRHLSQTRLEMP